MLGMSGEPTSGWSKGASATHGGHKHWIISWGPEIRYGRNYNFGDALQDENTRFEIEADFAKNVRYQFRVHRDMERYEGIDFDKRRFSMFGNVNTSRKRADGSPSEAASTGATRCTSIPLTRFWGVRADFDCSPACAPSRGSRRASTSTPAASPILTGSSFRGSTTASAARTGEVFDVMILRALSTYQFTDRLLFRNITEFNTHSEALGLNFLAIYRVNAGDRALRRL